MADYDNPQDLAHLFVNFTDLMTGQETPPEQTEIEVVYGPTRGEAVPGKVTLFGRARESAVWVETWRRGSCGRRGERTWASSVATTIDAGSTLEGAEDLERWRRTGSPCSSGMRRLLLRGTLTDRYDVFVRLARECLF